MNPRVKELLEQAKQLPDEDRAELGHELLASVETELVESQEDIEKAWGAELKRRIDDIDTGRVKLVPIEDVMQRLRARANG